MKVITLGAYDTFEDMLEDVHKIKIQLHNESWRKDSYTLQQLKLIEVARDLSYKLDAYLAILINPESFGIQSE